MPERKRKKRSLAVRMTALVISSILVSACASIYIVNTRANRLYQGEKHKQMLSVAKTFSYLIAGDLRRDKYFNVLKALEKLTNVEDVAWFRVKTPYSPIEFYADNRHFSSYIAGVTYTYTGKKPGELLLRINNKETTNNNGRLTAFINGKTATIDSEMGWQPTGVTIRPGEKVRISASGSYTSYDVWSGGNMPYGPDGIPVLGDKHGMIFPDRQRFSLIARVSGDPTLENLKPMEELGSGAPTREIIVDVTDGRTRAGTLSLGYFVKTPLEKARDKRISFVAEAMVPYVASLMRRFDFVEISYIAEKMVNIQDDVAYCMVLDQFNTVIFHSRRSLEGKPLLDTGSRNAYSAMMNGRDNVIQTLIDPVTRKAVLDVAVPVREKESISAIIRIGYFKAPLDRAIRTEQYRFFAVIFLLVIVGASVAVFVARRVARPILRLADVAVRIGKGDLDAHAEVHTGGDEIQVLAQAFNDMTRGLKEGLFVRDMFSRYVTRQVADELLKNPDGFALGGVRREVTILFADIRDFTSFSEHRPPEEVIARLNEYLPAMIDVIFKHEGTLDKFIGDAIMAVFGSPVSHPDDPVRAIRAALEMQESLNALNAHWESEDKPPFRIGIGINTGEVIAGNIGDARRMEYTVIGDSVNLASRIESFTKNYDAPIIITESTLSKISHAVDTVRLDTIAVKGKSEPIEIFKVIGMK